MVIKWNQNGKVEHIQKYCFTTEIYHVVIEDKHVEHVLHVCEYYFTTCLLDMFNTSILIISLYGEFRCCYFSMFMFHSWFTELNHGHFVLCTWLSYHYILNLIAKASLPPTYMVR